MSVRANDAFIQRLISSLSVADLGLGGFRLASAQLAPDRTHIVYAFEDTSDPAASLRIRVEPRSDHAHLAQTASFNVFVESQAGAPKISRQANTLVSHVVDSIRANDPAPEPVVWQSTITLYLIAGVVGDPRDLGARAVEILRDVPAILVEEGKEQISAELLAFHGVKGAQSRIVAIPEGPAGAAAALLDRMMDRGDDFCLFGADEGVPGFCDPGKEMLLHADDFGDRLCVRTVGGVSALAMALMRIPLGLSEFSFTAATPADPVETVCNKIRAGHDLPMMYFLTRDISTTARRMVDACLPIGAEVMLACNLTCHDEWFAWLRPGQPPHPLPGLTDSTRVVLLVRPRADRRQAVPQRV